MKVSVVGTGYVGLSLAVLISCRHEVVAVDIVKEKVDLINSGRSPIADADIQGFLSSGSLRLKATTDIGETSGSRFVIVATPTNYDPDTGKFDTSSVEGAVAEIRGTCPNATIVIKSTVPIGFTEDLCRRTGAKDIIFSPEFLREGKALHDNLHPSRIIVGVPGPDPELDRSGREFAGLLADCAVDSDVPTGVMGSTEAESVKLFSNTYLAMRVAFFNELDTFAEMHGLSSKAIIKGVCMDPRIGDFYNNPSFGYGGYCLPKDTKQLLSEYRDVPNSLIHAVVESNNVRKSFIAEEIEKRLAKGAAVGVYRLIMKSGSDNFRESSIFDIIRRLKDGGYRIIIFEPTLKGDYGGLRVEPDLGRFASESDIILANRMDPQIAPYRDKVFCRDIFNRD